MWIYLAAIIGGSALGAAWPQVAGSADALVWPALVVLLYATFVQVPVASVAAAVGDGRFLTAALVGNFVAIPALVWALLHLAPPDPALQLGLALVLLVPCTDWFITFTQLGGGDPARALAWTPIALCIQLALLPAYLWVMTDDVAGAVLGIGDMWPAAAVVAAPLLAAVATQRWASGAGGRRLVDRVGWWPVPLLALVITLVAMAHWDSARRSIDLLPEIGGLAVAYLVGALGLAVLIGRALRLDRASGRTLAFSLGTRNSFVVLPFALALPVGWELAALAVVVQSLVELVGMIICVRLVPGVLFPGRNREREGATPSVGTG